MIEKAEILIYCEDTDEALPVLAAVYTSLQLDTEGRMDIQTIQRDDNNDDLLVLAEVYMHDRL